MLIICDCTGFMLVSIKFIIVCALSDLCEGVANKRGGVFDSVLSSSRFGSGRWGTHEKLQDFGGVSAVSLALFEEEMCAKAEGLGDLHRLSKSYLLM